MSDLLAPFLVQGRSMIFVQLTGLCALLLIATVIWGQLDQRTLDGVAVWVKPAKFAVSFLVHFATLDHYCRRDVSRKRGAAYGCRCGLGIGSGVRC